MTDNALGLKSIFAIPFFFGGAKVAAICRICRVGERGCVQKAAFLDLRQRGVALCGKAGERKKRPLRYDGNGTTFNFAVEDRRIAMKKVLPYTQVCSAAFGGRAFAPPHTHVCNSLNINYIGMVYLHLFVLWGSFAVSILFNIHQYPPHLSAVRWRKRPKTYLL